MSEIQSTNQPAEAIPTAYLRAVPWHGEMPLEVIADLACCTEGRLTLDWGDGIRIGPIPFVDRLSHTYRQPGRYLVALELTDDNGYGAKASQVVCVRDSRRAFASLDVEPIQGEAPLTVLAFATQSVGDVFSLSWGDGHSESLREDDRIRQHVFREPGRYTLLLSVSKNVANGTLSETTSREILVSAKSESEGSTPGPSPQFLNEFKDGETFDGIPRGNLPTFYRLAMAHGRRFLPDAIQLFCESDETGRPVSNGQSAGR